MPNVSAFENQMPTNLSETSTKLVTEQITAAGDSLYRTSKEKYDLKARLIENADDWIYRCGETACPEDWKPQVQA